MKIIFILAKSIYFMENQKFRESVDKKKHEQVGNIPTYMMKEYNRNITKPEDFFSFK